jgi:hypothetical protein
MVERGTWDFYETSERGDFLILEISARVVGSVFAAAAATLAIASPASADAPSPHPKYPGVGASNT